MGNNKENKKIAIGCDHGGFLLKQEILKHLDAEGVEYETSVVMTQRLSIIPKLRLKSQILFQKGNIRSEFWSAERESECRLPQTRLRV